MPKAKVDVLASGAVCLGEDVVCDGFVSGCNVRVQTHLHDDHMIDFERSKGYSDIFLSPETFHLLVAERNADLPYRNNLHQISLGESRQLEDGSKLELLPSDHMLGACQVYLELPSGIRAGYSGDFSWPLREVIEVDELVVDSTYGSPNSIRRYTQQEAEQCLIGLVCERLRNGSVHINAYRGTIERVLHILGGNIGVPILASPQLMREARVYQEYGFATEGLVPLNSGSARVAMRAGSYVRLYSKGDGFGHQLFEGTSINVSAFMADPRYPLTRYSARSYKVALSNHADFNGTLEYVRATRARRVVTDNTRNHGVQLAVALKRHLGIEAEPSSNQYGPRWR